MKNSLLNPSFVKRKIKSLIISRLSSYFLFNLQCYAFLAYITSTKVKSSGKSNKKFPKIKCLAIYSPGGLEDLQAIAQSDAPINFEFIVVDYRFFAQLFRLILGDTPHDYGIHYRREHPLRLKYLEQVTNLLHWIKNNLFNFQGIINFNFVYYYTRDIEIAAGRINAKFVTLMKECLRTQAYIESTIKVYSQNVESYYGDLVLVHNNQTRTILFESGLFSCPIIVSGQPRSDLLKSIRKSSSPRTSSSDLNIVYFMISSRAGLPYFSGKHFDSTQNKIKPTEWIDINKRALTQIFAFMAWNPQLNLIIKGKPDLNYESLDIPYHLRDKVRVIDGNPSMNIYKNADLVLGFNSTCLVESHLASCNCASIELYDFDSSDICNYTLSLPDSILRIKNSDQLKELLSCLVSGTLNTPSVDRQYVTNYLDNVAFDSGRRSAQHLSDLLLNK